jgi:hypothetical protein
VHRRAAPPGRAAMRPIRRRRPSRVPELEFHRVLSTLDPAERRALVDLLRDELARGWIPKRADLEAALAVVRRPPPAPGTEP